MIIIKIWLEIQDTDPDVYTNGNSDGTPIPTLLGINIKKHLEPFKILTDFSRNKRWTYS